LQPFANIWDASFGPDGKLYALQLQRLVKLDLSTGTNEYILGSNNGGGGTPNCVGDQFTPPTYSLQSRMTVSSSGYVYIVDFNANWICVVNPAGQSSRYAGIAYGNGFAGDGGPALNA